MRDVSFVGEQVTFVRCGEFLKGFAPDPAARHRINGVSARGGVGLVIGNHLPRAYRQPHPLTGPALPGSRTVPANMVAVGSVIHLDTDDAVRDPFGEFDRPRPERAQPELGIDRTAAVNPSACSMRAGCPSMVTVSPASRPRTAAT